MLGGLVLFLTLLTDRRVLGFAPSPSAFSSAVATSSVSRSRPSPGLLSGTGINCNSNDELDVDETASPERRGALRRMAALAASLSSLAVTSSSPRPAEAASSDLFKPNPLTNSVLEQMRIWNQDEADNIRYGGELESGSAKPAAFDQYVRLLQPILAVEGDLGEVGRLLSGKVSSNEEYVAMLEKADAILSKPLFEKIQFKKAFNAFADNIYYSDPDRANLYLGGGAVPKTTQSIAYLLRNDVLTNVEDMRAEARYLLRELAKEGDGGIEMEDIVGMSKAANEVMVKYLELVPPGELEAARSKFAAQ
ncbi:hypothetical protein ACHAWF_003028 [Thalassiosira exigua]